MKKIHLDSDFNFWLPAEFKKSKDSKGNEIMRVKGIASNSDIDSEGEILEPIGFDLNRFLKIGLINWNHMGKTSPDKIIGEPEVAKVTNKGELYVEGVLYPNSNFAKSVWELGETLKENSKTRKLGWSIEGKALERDPMNPKRITRALITGIAITPTPVNANTYVEFAKGIQKKDFIDYEFEEKIEIENNNRDLFLYEFKVGDELYGITKSFDCIKIIKSKKIDMKKENKKSKNKIHRVMKEFKEGKLKDSHGNLVTSKDQAIAIAMSEAGLSKNKSMDTNNTRPLIPESLEGKKKDILKKAIRLGIFSK